MQDSDREIAEYASYLQGLSTLATSDGTYFPITVREFNPSFPIKQNLKASLLKNRPLNNLNNLNKTFAIDAVHSDTIQHIAQLIKKPYAALRGVHVFVHSLFGIPFDSNPAESFYSDEQFPSQWTETSKSFDPNKSKTQVDQASSAIESWYYKSRQLNIKTEDLQTLFSSQCFTIDVDNMFYDTLPSSQINNKDKFKAINSIEQTNSRSFQLFLEILKQHFSESDYDIVEESNSTSGWQYEENSKRRYGIFINNHILQDKEKMSHLLSFKGFLNAVYYFLMNKYSDYDSFIGQYTDLRKHYFIEIIGFTSSDEWQSSAHDFSMYNSRLDAWNKWILRNDLQPKLCIHGIYTIQTTSIAPFASLDRYSPNHTANDFNSKAQFIFSLLIPMSVDYSKMIKLDENNHYLSLNQAINNLKTNKKYAQFKSHFEYIATKTQLPLFLTENVLNPFDHDTFFHRDEFDWYNTSTLGKGTYGQVLKVRWQASHKTSNVQRGVQTSNRRHMLKHHMMILETLANQRKVSILSKGYRMMGSNDAAIELESFPKMIERMVVERDGGLVEHYLDANQMEQELAYNNLIRYVIVSALLDGHQISEKWLVDKDIFNEDEIELLRQKTEDYVVTSYAVDVRINLAVKMSDISIEARKEAAIIRILTASELWPTIYYDPRNGDYQFDDSSAPRGDFMTDIDIEISQSTLSIQDRTLSRTFKFDNTNFPDVQFKITSMGAENIVSCYGSCYDQHLFFLILPIKPLGSLYSVIRRTQNLQFKKPTNGLSRDQLKLLKLDMQQHSPTFRPLSLYEFVQILHDCAKALAYINMCGLAHGDFKWDNILIDENRRAFVSDFGLTKPYGVYTNGINGTTGYVHPDFSNQKSPMEMNFSSSDPFLDTFAFGRCILPDEIHFPKQWNNMNDSYLKPEVAQIIGCRFTHEMVDLLPLDDSDITSDVIQISRDVRVPYSQCPISRHIAEKVCADLRRIAELTTYQNSPETIEAIKNQIITHPMSIRREGVEPRTLNRLVIAQAILQQDLKLIETDVTQNWKDYII